MGRPIAGRVVDWAALARNCGQSVSVSTEDATVAPAAPATGVVPTPMGDIAMVFEVS